MRMGGLCDDEDDDGILDDEMRQLTRKKDGL